MRRVVWVVAFLACWIPQVARAQAAEGEEGRRRVDVPHVVILGLIAYRDRGPDDAVKTWIKDSVLEGNKDAMSVAETLRQAQGYYGVYRNFEVLSTQDLSLRVRVVYVVMNFDKGPLFGKFMAFRSEDHGWLLLDLDFNMRPEAILPMATPPASALAQKE